MPTTESDDLVAYLEEDPRVRPLEKWAWGLSRWGQPVLVRVALALAEACVARWSQGAPHDKPWQRHYAASALPRESLAVLRSALARGAPAKDARLESHAEALRALVHEAEFESHEGLGDVTAQEEATAAARTVLMALEAARWTVERACADIPDEAEREAIAGAGPTLELLEAIRSYRRARPESTPLEVRERIRDALRER